jgi:hypothetical protein
LFDIQILASDVFDIVLSIIKVLIAVSLSEHIQLVRNLCRSVGGLASEDFGDLVEVLLEEATNRDRRFGATVLARQVES